MDAGACDGVAALAGACKAQEAWRMRKIEDFRDLLQYFRVQVLKRGAHLVRLGLVDV